jgi:DNA-binding MarR family transcriptional regulator
MGAASQKDGPTIPDEVLTAIRQITQAIDLHSRHLIKKHGITGPQLMILRVVQNKEAVVISEIARNTSLSISTVTGILMRLEKRGFVRREKSGVDKRRVIVNLTKEGKKFLSEAPEPLQESFLLAFNQLERWEKLMILSSLQRLVSLMKAERIDVSPILATGPIELPLPPEDKSRIS